MLLVEEFCSLTTFWSNQLHLRKLDGVLRWETSDSSSDQPNLSCPFCTKIFDEKAEVVEHLDTCDGTKDLSAMILLSAIRRFKIISTTATSLMIFPCSDPRLSKKRLKWLNLWRYRDINTQEFPMRLFCQEIFHRALDGIGYRPSSL